MKKIKKLCRFKYHTVPYKRYTILITQYLVEGRFHWINSFPFKNGVFRMTRPADIAQGISKPDMRNEIISFGSYSMLYT